MIITFCGHADFKASEEYERKILNFLCKNVGNSPAQIYLGEYGNFDKFAYRCCKRYKETHPNILLIFVTPYITVEYQKNHIEPLRKIYDEIIYPEIENRPLRFAIIYRNKWMIDKADYVICGIAHNWGGAYKTYQYAIRKKKFIFNVFDNEI